MCYTIYAYTVECCRMVVDSWVDKEGVTGILLCEDIPAPRRKQQQEEKGFEKGSGCFHDILLNGLSVEFFLPFVMVETR